MDDQAKLWDKVIDKVCEKTDNPEDVVDRADFFKKYKFQLQVEDKGKQLTNFDKNDICRHLAARGYVMTTRSHGYPCFKYMKLK